MPQIINLNDVEPETDANLLGTKRNRDNSCSSGAVTVYFRGLVRHLCEHIDQADLVLGCVAWLTHPMVLAALRRPSAAIVVQKEDFLRPDFGTGQSWKAELRSKYDALHCDVGRFNFSNMVGRLDTCGDTSIEPVRCVGNYNREKAPAFPRMHNKFLVFARIIDRGTVDEIQPYAVWTGSFNLTFNAANSLENALYLTDKNIVDAYYNEFGQIMALSERLDWESDWTQPDWRIGS